MLPIAYIQVLVGYKISCSVNGYFRHVKNGQVRTWPFLTEAEMPKRVRKFHCFISLSPACIIEKWILGTYVSENHLYTCEDY